MSTKCTANNPKQLESIVQIITTHMSIETLGQQPSLKSPSNFSQLKTHSRLSYHGTTCFWTLPRTLSENRHLSSSCIHCRTTVNCLSLSPLLVSFFLCPSTESLRVLGIPGSEHLPSSCLLFSCLVAPAASAPQQVPISPASTLKHMV